MLKRILVVVATDIEADALRKIPGMVKISDGLRFGKCEISLLVTGVGTMATSWSMMKWVHMNPKPDLALNIGIAGCYRDDIEKGDVVAPVSDCFADSGVETEDGFKTLTEAGMGDPFIEDGVIAADNPWAMMITAIARPVKAITVNTVTGTVERIRMLTGKFNPGIETMEGAAFFYICLRENIPFAALRAISNRVEPGSRKNWDIPQAVSSLSVKLKDFLLMVE